MTPRALTSLGIGGAAPGQTAVRPCRRRVRALAPARSFVLFAVVVVIGISLLVVLGFLMLVRGESAGAASLERSAQSRALAWSGLQAVGDLLDRQRGRILAGETPTLRRQITVYEAGTVAGVVRLLEVGPEGALLVAEAGKIDLNHADAAALAATGLVDGELAARIVEHRAALGGRCQSELELLGVAGLSIETVVGPLEALGSAFERARAGNEATSRGGRPATARGSVPAPPTSSPSNPGAALPTYDVEASVQGLADVVTVHAVEPRLQRDGTRRIRLDGPWSEELGRQFEERFGPAVAEVARAVMQTPAESRSDATIAVALRHAQAPPEAWATALDAFTAQADELALGRLDLNHASYEALLSLPEITPPQATEIVRQRPDLTAEERASVAWPLMRGIVDAEQMARFAHLATVRSWSWRVRLLAGEVAVDDPEGPVQDAVIWEAVIDLTTPRWRVAYLRDITLLPVAGALAATAPEGEEEEERELPEPPAAPASTDGALTDSDATTEPTSEPDSPEAAPAVEPYTDSDAPAASGGRDPAPASDSLDAPAQTPASPKDPSSSGPAPVGRWRT